MTLNHTWRKQALKFALLLLVGVSLHAHAGLFGIGGDSWKEEVLLHDGQKMIGERSQTYGGRSEPGQSGPIAEHSIRFTLPHGGQSFTWTSEYSQDIGRTNFNLLAVHVKDGTPYLVVEPNLCLSYNKWGRPNPPYVFFMNDGNTWQRIPLEQFPVEFTTINVAHNTVGRDAKVLAAMGLVPLEKVREMNVSSNPMYQRILREALPPAKIISMCDTKFTNGKGTWLGADWFSGEENLAACLRVCDHKEFKGDSCPCGQFFKGN